MRIATGDPRGGVALFLMFVAKTMLGMKRFRIYRSPEVGNVDAGLAGVVAGPRPSSAQVQETGGDGLLHPNVPPRYVIQTPRIC
jgi:hypothetical protein